MFPYMLNKILTWLDLSALSSQDLSSIIIFHLFLSWVFFLCSQWKLRFDSSVRFLVWSSRKWLLCEVILVWSVNIDNFLTLRRYPNYFKRFVLTISTMLFLTQSLVLISLSQPAFTCQWRRSGIFIVNFEHISHLVLAFLLLILNM